MDMIFGGLLCIGCKLLTRMVSLIAIVLEDVWGSWAGQGSPLHGNGGLLLLPELYKEGRVLKKNYK